MCWGCSGSGASRPGETADRGTFVYYDHTALLGVLLLEASRAGAVVIGEDVGTVAPYVVHELARREVLGCDILWFALGPDPGSGEMRPNMPEDWRALTMASLSTHDLPTAAGFLDGEHVRVREELHLLRSVEDEWSQARHERQAWLDALRSKGILPPDDGTPVAEDDFVLGLYAWLARTPSRLLGASLSDVVGDVRQPNLPGTIDEYPSWRLPIADAARPRPAARGPDGRADGRPGRGMLTRPIVTCLPPRLRPAEGIVRARFVRVATALLSGLTLPLVAAAPAWPGSTTASRRATPAGCSSCSSTSASRSRSSCCWPR